MKKIAFYSLLIFTLFACKKSSSTSYQVRYLVSGNAVKEFKISYGVVDKQLIVPFSGTKDTTIMQPAGTSVKLDAKADNNNLYGAIYVNGSLVTSATDTDSNADGKTEVKLDYTLPH